MGSIAGLVSTQAIGFSTVTAYHSSATCEILSLERAFSWACNELITYRISNIMKIVFISGMTKIDSISITDSVST